MDLEINKSNVATLCGKVLTKPEYTHELYGEGFYEFMLGVDRLSDYEDKIPITISEKLIKENKIDIGKKILLKGQLRSYNKLVEGRSKLILTVFAREVFFEETIEASNTIELSGYICKEPIYRTTPFNREICDILIAVNRAYNKSDYLPCIAWGRNARFIRDCRVGEKVFISGRIQSREYQKKFDDGNVETRVAYEISVNKINLEAANLEILHDSASQIDEERVNKA